MKARPGRGLANGDVASGSGDQSIGIWRDGQKLKSLQAKQARYSYQLLASDHGPKHWVIDLEDFLVLWGDFSISVSEGYFLEQKWRKLRTLGAFVRPCCSTFLLPVRMVLAVHLARTGFREKPRHQWPTGLSRSMSQQPTRVHQISPGMAGTPSNLRVTGIVTWDSTANIQWNNPRKVLALLAGLLLEPTRLAGLLPIP